MRVVARLAANLCRLRTPRWYNRHASWEKPMTITFTCPCGKRLQVAETLRNREGQCPACGQLLRIPGEPPPAAFPNLTLDDPARSQPASESDLPEHTNVAPETNPLDFASMPGDSRPYFRLPSPLGVVGAAWIGGAVAGCFLLSANFRAQRRPRIAVATALLGVLTIVALLGAIQA